MYQKIKYIIIATIVLLTVMIVLTLDANTRYNAMKKGQIADTPQNSEASAEDVQRWVEMKNAERQQQIQTLKEKYGVTTPEAQSNDEDINEENVSINELNHYLKQKKLNKTQAYESPEKQEYANKTTDFTQKTNNHNEIEIIADQQVQLTSDEIQSQYFYSAEKIFKLGNDIYAIVVSYNTTIDSEYMNKKYTIYKKVNNEYKYSNYLFETTINKNNTNNLEKIEIQQNPDSITINYKGNSTIKRNIDLSLLKNSYLQYSNYPTLKNAGQSTEADKTMYETEQNTIDLQP